MRKRLIFKPAKVAELTMGLTTKAEAEIVDLHSRIKKIYERVNMDVSFALITSIPRPAPPNDYLFVVCTRSADDP